MNGRFELQRFLKEIEVEKAGLPKDLHITRMCCALVAVSNGHVIKITEPKLQYCPARDSPIGAEPLNICEVVVKGIERKICNFGHFTAKRKLCSTNIAVPFGASEMMMYALKKGKIEATVTVCDGAGTVITSNPQLLQGIGAHMTGLFYTSPIPEIIERIEENGGHVVFPETAKIDQVEGLKEAIKMGYKRIAVTINGYIGESLIEVRNIEREFNVSVTCLVVCTTGVERKRAEEVASYADLAWGCASFYIRKIAGGKAKLQLGVRIPVFVFTARGINFVDIYSCKELKKYVCGGKKYLVTLRPKGEGAYRKIKMGNFDAYLLEVGRLPVESEDMPRPLL